MAAEDGLVLFILVSWWTSSSAGISCFGAGWDGGDLQSVLLAEGLRPSLLSPWCVLNSPILEALTKIPKSKRPWNGNTTLNTFMESCLCDASRCCCSKFKVVHKILWIRKLASVAGNPQPVFMCILEHEKRVTDMPNSKLRWSLT